MTPYFRTHRRTSLLLPPCVVFSALTCSFAQSVSVPRLGLVFDESASSLREISGIKSGAWLGLPLNFGTPLDRTWVAPAGAFAIGDSPDKPALLLLDPSSGSALAIDGLDRNPDQLVFSRRGKALAAYYSRTQSIKVVTGLPGSPRFLLRSVRPLPSKLVSMAVSDDGSLILAGTYDRNQGAVFAITGSPSPRLIASPTMPASIAVLPGDNDALIADSAESQIVRVSGLQGSPSVITIAGEHEGVLSPVALGVSLDGKQVLVVTQASDEVLAMDLSAGTKMIVKCKRPPSSLEQLAGNFVFALNSQSNLEVFDGDAGTPRILFVSETGSTRRKLTADGAIR